ncbi:hypothetical protein ZOSMA_77G00570 [Zostera marina]|uniref:Uncharacterized protein n=1 Tax=Zostera marina TaxID=29655 RepID=A0A0K9NQN3_ZOSMR|nr:hypothetical protein ZOSMA_77G00570 [Zostera marina]
MEPFSSQPEDPLTIPHRQYTSSTASPPILPLPQTYTSNNHSNVLHGSILGHPPQPPVNVVYGGCPQPKNSCRDRSATLVNTSTGYIRNNGGLPVSVAVGAMSYPVTAAHAQKPYTFPNTDHLPQQPSASNCNGSHNLPQFSVPRPVLHRNGGIANGQSNSTARVSPSVSQSKMGSHPTTQIPIGNRYKEPRDKSSDSSVVVFYDRKVRLLDSPRSLYSLSRSWVQNGLSQESQPSSGDGVRLLPKPLSLSPVNKTSEKASEKAEIDTNKEPSEEELERLTEDDLLQRHIKRAKNIRSRLKGNRLRRINRYRQRLSLLLPLPMEQDGNNESLPVN